MKLGAEPKKMAILGALLLLAAYLFYSNVFSGPSEPPASSTTTARKIETPAPIAPPATLPQLPTGGGGSTEARPNVSRAGGRSLQEFRPTLKPRRPEERIDPNSVDPTLRLDLLAKLQKVELQGGQRSLFDFSTAPPPEAPKKPEAKIIPTRPVQGPKLPPELEPKPPEPPKPPPPPIPFKFYGFVQASAGPGQKRAFFLEGEDIHVAGEGEVIKKRYKVVRIGVNSVVVEDLDHKHQQTLPLEQQVTG